MTKGQVFGCPKNKIRLLVLPCWYQIILESAYCVLVSNNIIPKLPSGQWIPIPLCHQQSTLASSSAMVKGTWKWLCDASIWWWYRPLQWCLSVAPTAPLLYNDLGLIFLIVIGYKKRVELCVSIPIFLFTKF